MADHHETIVLNAQDALKIWHVLGIYAQEQAAWEGFKSSTRIKWQDMADNGLEVLKKAMWPNIQG